MNTPAERAIRSVDRNRELLSRGERFAFGEEDPPNPHRCLYVFRADPAAAVHAPNGTPAILLFFSSFWESGLVSQFAPHCLHYAQRGMTAIAVDYRIRDTGGNGIIDALADARDAWKSVINNAVDLGIDPSRVVIGGGGGGAWLAATIGMGLRENKSIDVPAVLPIAQVLFHPLLDIRDRAEAVAQIGTRAAVRGLNPAKHIKKGTPPTFIAHGAADQLIPIESSIKFSKWMKRRKNRHEFVRYDGVGGNFYNLNVNERLYENVLNASDLFLVNEGLLEPMEQGSHLI